MRHSHSSTGTGASTPATSPAALAFVRPRHSHATSAGVIRRTTGSSVTSTSLGSATPSALASLQSVAIDGLVWACSTCTSMPLLRPARAGQLVLAPAAARPPLTEVGGERGLDAARVVHAVSILDRWNSLISCPSCRSIACAWRPRSPTLRPDFAVLRAGRPRRRQRTPATPVGSLAARRRGLRGGRRGRCRRTSPPGRTPTARSAPSRSAPRRRWRRCGSGRAAGGLPRVNWLVDLYNAVSVRHVLPVGGEDLARFVGPIRLIRAAGDEPFDTVAKRRARSSSIPSPGEVVWADDLGVTCRRWNWRQGTRTRLTEASTDVLFLLERLAPMPLVDPRRRGRRAGGRRADPLSRRRESNDAASARARRRRS